MDLPPKSIPCTVLILTRNSASTLPRALRNLSPFAEVLVHDGNSVDETVAIAKRFGARVEKQYDTDEPSVRVKNFTEIRLKQRAAALHDWVLYLDADEELSDELVEEIDAFFRTGPDPKTIVKVPRLPVIEGRVRTDGVFYPEMMPRIHHRGSSATLKQGKTVHEKYVYDASFREVVLRRPLLVPLPSVSNLRSKDDRYLTLEVEKIWREGGMGWGHYVRWILLREPLIILSLLLRILWFGPRYLRRDSVPLMHDLRYVRYHWRLLRAMTGLKLRT